MISDIFDKVAQKLKDLDLIQVEEYFDQNNIPDSLSDKSFLIAPVPITPGDYNGSSTQNTMDGRIISLKGAFKILILRKVTANQRIALLKASMDKTESIIKELLSSDLTASKTNKIVFLGSDYLVDTPTILLQEMNFSDDYRITNF